MVGGTGWAGGCECKVGRGGWGIEWRELFALFGSGSILLSNRSKDDRCVDRTAPIPRQGSEQLLSHSPTYHATPVEEGEAVISLLQFLESYYNFHLPLT